MSEPIKVGDLVVMIGFCCIKGEAGGFPRKFGIPYRVEKMIKEHRSCSYCHTSWGSMWAGDDRNSGSPTKYLKRIPPLSELEGERTQEKLKEPACH